MCRRCLGNQEKNPGTKPVQGSNLLMPSTALVIWVVVCGVELAVAPGESMLGAWLSFLRVLVSLLLIFLFPLLLGATAVAAERQMGLAGWQSSLPVSRARQWWVKLLVVMSLAVAGGGVPAGYLDLLFVTLLEGRPQAPTPLVPPAVWLSVPVLSAAAGVYASSRAREPCRALMGGVALFVLMLVPATFPSAHQTWGVGLPSSFFPRLPGAELYLGVAVATLALLAFAFANFRPEPWFWEKPGGRAARWLVLTALLVHVASAVVDPSASGSSRCRI